MHYDKTHETYESILGRMIDEVEGWAKSEGVSIDTREGSLIRTALSPAAVELRQMYIELDAVLNETFADTASREFLILRCAERGIAVLPATKAIWKGVFDIDVKIGSRFFLEASPSMNFAVIEKMAPCVYKLECETPGTSGNYENGNLVSISKIEGLKKAEIPDSSPLLLGEDEEDTEHLRRRYFDSINAQAFGGNIADYKEKVNKLQDVGGCKVYPVPKGVGGTVRVVIMDSNFGTPGKDLINAVQEALDPERNRGKGMGLAPIGHTVTVAGVSENKIDIEMELRVQKDVSIGDVKLDVVAAIDEYFKELRSQWDKVGWEQDANATLIVRIYHILTRILAVTGVVDVEGITLNGLEKNITLETEAIPAKGSISIKEKI